MKYRYIRFLTVVAIFVCYLVALLTLQDHVIYYQEQHSLFLFSKLYFKQTLHSQGPLGYLGSFMVQFYYYPWLGAIIVSFLACCVYWFTESIIYRLFGVRDFLQLGVIGAVALYFTLDGLDESPAWILIAACGLFIIWLAVSLIFRRKCSRVLDKKLSLIQIIVPIFFTVAYILGGFWIEASLLDRAERYMIRAERAIKNKNWDEAIEITSAYLGTGRINKLMLYLRSYALAQKGELIDHMFDYQHRANQQSLAFPWKSNTREAEYGHWAHEATGDINAAHQWAFEAMTAWGETASHLEDLGRYNVALGRPEVAKKFADKLGQSLFYKDRAEAIKRAIKGEEDLGLNYAQPDSCITKWINVLDFRPNLMQNYQAAPSNEIIRQYLMASMLLNNDLRLLIPLLKPSDLEHENIREAVLIYSLDPQAVPLKEFGFKVDEETGRKFADFYRMLKKGDRRELDKKYGKTYWYYKHLTYPTEIR